MNEKLDKIVKEIEEINKVLKNTRISELCNRLYCLSKSLKKLELTEGFNYDSFELLFFKPVIIEGGEIVPTSEVTVHLYSCGVKVGEIKVSEDTTIAELLLRIRENEEIRRRLLDEMQIVLHEIIREIVLRADLVRRVEEVENKIEDIRRKLEPDP